MVLGALFSDKVTLFSWQVQYFSLVFQLSTLTPPSTPQPCALPHHCLPLTIDGSFREEGQEPLNPPQVSLGGTWGPQCGGAWAQVTLKLVGGTQNEDSILGSLSWAPWNMAEGQMGRPLGAQTTQRQVGRVGEVLNERLVNTL
jgi:hypothetical protein